MDLPHSPDPARHTFQKPATVSQGGQGTFEVFTVFMVPLPPGLPPRTVGLLDGAREPRVPPAPENRKIGKSEGHRPGQRKAGVAGAD